MKTYNPIHFHDGLMTWSLHPLYGLPTQNGKGDRMRYIAAWYRRISHTLKKKQKNWKDGYWMVHGCFDKKQTLFASLFSSFPDTCRLPSQTRSYPTRSPELQYCRKIETPRVIGSPTHATRSITLCACHPGGLVRRIQPMVSQCWDAPPRPCRNFLDWWYTFLYNL